MSAKEKLALRRKTREEGQSKEGRGGSTGGKAIEVASSLKRDGDGDDGEGGSKTGDTLKRLKEVCVCVGVCVCVCVCVCLCVCVCVFVHARFSPLSNACSCCLLLDTRHAKKLERFVNRCPRKLPLLVPMTRPGMGERRTICADFWESRRRGREGSEEHIIIFLINCDKSS